MLMRLKGISLLEMKKTFKYKNQIYTMEFNYNASYLFYSEFNNQPLNGMLFGVYRNKTEKKKLKKIEVVKLCFLYYYKDTNQLTFDSRNNNPDRRLLENKNPEEFTAIIKEQLCEFTSENIRNGFRQLYGL